MLTLHLEVWRQKRSHHLLQASQATMTVVGGGAHYHYSVAVAAAAAAASTSAASVAPVGLQVGRNEPRMHPASRTLTAEQWKRSESLDVIERQKQ